MTPSRAILTGALILAAALFLAERPVSATGTGPYILSPHSNTTANVGIFRMDSTTGEVSYCYMTNGAELTCTRGVK